MPTPNELVRENEHLTPDAVQDVLLDYGLISLPEDMELATAITNKPDDYIVVNSCGNSEPFPDWWKGDRKDGIIELSYSPVSTSDQS